MPGLVIGGSGHFVGEAWIGAGDAAGNGGAIQPAHFPSGTAYHGPRLIRTLALAATSSGAAFAPATRRTAKPTAWSNAPPFPALSLRIVLKPLVFVNANTLPGVSARRIASPSLHPGGPAFFAAQIKAVAKAPSHTNGGIIYGLDLTRRITPNAYASAGQIYTASVSAASNTKTAPHRISAAQTFAPTVTFPATTSVTVTLSPPGATARASNPAPRRSQSTWPNLPKVAAPPWQLTVVTPKLARERARARLAAAKRLSRERRKRKADERTNEIADALIDDTVVRTIVDVMAKAG